MDLFDVVKSCLRRWYVVAPLLLATAVFAIHFYNSKGKPLYYSSAVVGLAASNSMVGYYPGQPSPRNGLIEVGGPNMVMNMAVLAYKDPAVVAQVQQAGGRNFSARMFSFNAAGSPNQELPMIIIDTIQDDPALAVRTVQLAVDQADPILRNLQLGAGVPEILMAHALVTGAPSVSGGITDSRVKTTILISAIGGGVSALVGVSTDVLLSRRQTRRGRSKSSYRRPLGEEKCVDAGPGREPASGRVTGSSAK